MKVLTRVLRRSRQYHDDIATTELLVTCKLGCGLIPRLGSALANSSAELNRTSNQRCPIKGGKYSIVPLYYFHVRVGRFFRTKHRLYGAYLRSSVYLNASLACIMQSYSRDLHVYYSYSHMRRESILNRRAPKITGRRYEAFDSFRITSRAEAL